LTVVPDGPNAEWDVFSFSTTGGGPLASNFGARWQLDLTSLPFNQSVFFDGFFAQWTVNGSAVSPISNIGGIDNINPNPTSIVPGPVYGGLFPPFLPAATSFDLPNLIFVSPCSFVSAGGIDPNTANDFHAGLHFSAANPQEVVVPDPSSIALFGLAGLGLLGWAWQRRKRVAA
jgi:hypothetical protein